MHRRGSLLCRERIGTLEVTASVGVAALEFADDTPELILKRADQALYCAKRDGRNRVVADAAELPSALIEAFSESPVATSRAERRKKPLPGLYVAAERLTLRLYAV